MQAVKSPVLREVVRTFEENTTNVLGLAAFPVFAFTKGRESAHHISYLIKALKAVGNTSAYPMKGDLSKKLQEEASRLIAEEDDKIETQLAEEFETEIDMWTKIPGVRSAVRALLLAVVSASWTTLETLLADMWGTILNRYPVSLGQRAFEAAPSPDATDVLSGKQIQIGLLAKHGFDLRGCLGDILKSKFDFTSVSGIQKAYGAIFGESEALKKSTEVPELRELEVVRHLIVHKAGIIDDEYKRRAKCALAVGAPLPIDAIAASRWASSGISSGCGMIRLADSTLADLREPETR